MNIHDDVVSTIKTNFLNEYAFQKPFDAYIGTVSARTLESATNGPLKLDLGECLDDVCLNVGLFDITKKSIGFPDEYQTLRVNYFGMGPIETQEQILGE